jgi:hypothetical protein
LLVVVAVVVQEQELVVAEQVEFNLIQMFR